tara:strand:- start:10397 stop:11362 length:966 start_codon:yes stop_codon:yes gene_type:complete
MPVIDRSEEIDLDIGVQIEDEAPEKEIAPNPIFEEMEEEEAEEAPRFDPKAEERAFYQSLSETEKEAWDRGWRTGRFFKGKYKDGTPKPHKSAEDFLAMQEKETPILNERNRKLAKEKTVLETQVAELGKQMQVLLNVQKIAQESQFTKSYASLDEAEENAILEGDVAKVRAIRQQRDDLAKSKVVFDEPEVEQPRNQINRDEKALFDNWTADNTWFHQDKVLQAVAAAYFGDLSERIPLQERLEMVTEEVEKRFSDKLGISKAPRVESGQRGIKTGKAQHSYNDLPADVRKNCDFMAKRHNFSKDQVARMQQEAIKEYFN